jgi:hypothetical protein
MDYFSRTSAPAVSEMSPLQEPMPSVPASQPEKPCMFFEWATMQMPGDYTLGIVKLLFHGIENRLIFKTYQADFHILKCNTRFPPR